MRRSVRWLQAGALGLGLLMAGLLLARVLTTPVSGNVLIVASARHAERIDTSVVELHSTRGWMRLGSFRGEAVSKAPDTTTLLQATAPTGSYDAIRLSGHVLPAQIQVQRYVLSTVLVAVADRRPASGGVYAGTESVSLGLNELAGQMKTVPSFSLIDQFGRPVTTASLADHEVIVAAFHTTCHESCPIYTGLFLQLRRQLPPSVMLIEATTDPWTDTPDVLRQYAGQIGASWTFLTGDPAALSAFWQPFDVELSTSDVHRSTLALIDAHGYIRSYYLGTPDIGGDLPSPLTQLLNSDGQQLLRSRGNGWGQAQVLDSLRAMGGVASRSSVGEGVAPDFILTTLDGRQITLSKLRGRPVVINFWATYCLPCRREMPMLQRVAQAHPSTVLLLVDERDDQGAASAFVKQLGITSPVPLDPDGKVGDLYRVAGLPTTLFLRADGSIEARYLGETNEQILGPHLAAIGA